MELKQEVMKEGISGISEGCWQYKHHLTILMLDLSDEVKFNMAKQVL